MARPQIHAVTIADRVEIGAVREPQRRHEGFGKPRLGGSVVAVGAGLFPLRDRLDVPGGGQVARTPPAQIVRVRGRSEAEIGTVLPVPEVVAARPAGTRPV